MYFIHTEDFLKKKNNSTTTQKGYCTPNCLIGKNKLLFFKIFKKLHYVNYILHLFINKRIEIKKNYLILFYFFNFKLY